MLKGQRSMRLWIVIAALCTISSGQAYAQRAQVCGEPMGWPLRENPCPKETPQARSGPAAPQKPAAEEPVPPPAAAQRLPEETALSIPGLAPLERIVVPPEDIEFDYADDRIALTRTETTRLERLAYKLRQSADVVHISAYTAATDKDRKSAMTLSLTRALTVRQYLLNAGVPAERIDVSAYPDANGAGGSSLTITAGPRRDRLGAADRP